METLSCHSNQSEYETAIINNMFVEDAMNISAKFQLIQEVWTKIIYVVEDHSANSSKKLSSKYLQWNSNKCQFSFFPLSHWSMFTSAYRWQRRLAVRYYVGFLEQNGYVGFLEQNDCAHEKLTEMVCISFLLMLILNRKTCHLPPSTREYKSHSVLRMWRALGDPFLHFAIIRDAIQKG